MIRRQRRRRRRISCAEPLGLAGVVAVGDDHHGGARIDHAPRVPAIEGGEALADAGAAADALRHQREPVDRARHVAVAQRRRDMREPRVEHEGLGLAEGIDHAVQEAHEERGVEAHRAGGVEQHDQPQRLDLAPPPDEIDRRAAMRDAAVDGAAQVEPPPAPARLLAAHQPRPHGAGEPRGERVAPARSSSGSTMWRRSVVGEVLGARGAFAAAAAVGRRRRRRAVAPLDMVGQRRCVLRRLPPWRGAAAAARLSRRRARRASARWRMPRPRQKASKISSNRSQSEWVAQNSARSAGFSDDGRVAAGDARTASASRVSARPTLKPLSRSVRAKPARRRRVGRRRSLSPGSRDAAAVMAHPSRHLAEQALASPRGSAARGPRGS